MALQKYLLSIAVLAITPSIAIADGSASSRVTLKGTAEEVCVMPPPRATGSANASFDGETATISDLIDDATATVNPFSLQITYSGVMCNYNATVSLTSMRGGLQQIDGERNVAASSGTMLTEIDYVASISWGSVQTPALETAAHSGSARVDAVAGGANLADLILTVAAAKGETPVLLGTYEDTLIINIGPNP